MNRAVFLDRDGVINRVILRGGRPCSPCSIEELEFLPGVGEGIEALRRAGFRIIVVTNQPDVATGLQARSVVELMHRRLHDLFPIDNIKVCYHVDRDNCLCRKPKPGMLLQAAKELDLDLKQSFVVGDRWRDIEAGRAAGCKTILVGGGYGEKLIESPDAVVTSLWEAARMILSFMV